MAWVVRAGRHVTHDGREYLAGAEVPCTAEQGQSCSAVDWVERMQMKADTPAEAAALEAEPKAKKRGK